VFAVDKGLEVFCRFEVDSAKISVFFLQESPCHRLILADSFCFSDGCSANINSDAAKIITHN